MFKNYFRTAFEIFKRNSAFSFINVLGLSIGISAALVIFLIVQYDYSFDKFEKGGDRIYRVVENYELKLSGKSHGSAATPDPLGKAIENEVSGLEAVAALRPGNEAKLSVPAENGRERKVFPNQKQLVFTDAGYFNLLAYDWLAGNPKTALQEPYQLVLTASRARLYFPGLTAGQVIGRHLYVDDSVSATVTGVVKDLGANTSFNYAAFFSRITLENTSLKPRFWDRWEHTQP